MANHWLAGTMTDQSEVVLRQRRSAHHIRPGHGLCAGGRNFRVAHATRFRKSDHMSLQKRGIIDESSRLGIVLRRKSRDRSDFQVDYRIIDILLLAAEDPEVYLGSFAMRVRVGPRARLTRSLALSDV